MKLSLIILFIIPLVSPAQVRSVIKAQFKLLKPPEKLYIVYPTGKTDSVPFPATGIYEMHFEGKEAGILSFRPSSSNVVNIWVDEGAIAFTATETKLANGSARLEISSFKGPAESELFYQAFKPGKTDFYFAPSLSKKDRDSIIRADNYKRDWRFVDSIIKLRPNSAVTPHIMLSRLNNLGREAVSDLYYRLSEFSRNSAGGREVLSYLESSFVLQKGTTVSDFSMPDANGEKFTLSAVKEKYILIDFWASWCAPCRAAHPDLARNFGLFKDRGFTIVSLSLDENRSEWLTAIGKDRLTWTNISDLKGRRNALAIRYRINPIPFNVMLDENRRVVATNLFGRSLTDFLEERLKE